MPETSNTAKLPEGPRVSKHHEITPDPEVLKGLAHVVTVKPASGVVLVHGKTGQIVARYFDEEFAREEFDAAGLDFDKLKAATVLKAEQEARNAQRRVLSRPDRRLRSERRKERGGGKPEGGKAGKMESGKAGEETQ